MELVLRILRFIGLLGSVWRASARLTQLVVVYDLREPDILGKDRQDECDTESYCGYFMDREEADEMFWTAYPKPSMTKNRKLCLVLENW